MVTIKIGYLRGVENSHSYKTQLHFLKSSDVERIFHEKSGGNVVLNELIDYARSGDIIFVYSISSLGKNVKSIIRFIMQTQRKNTTLYIKKEKFDSSSKLGKYVLNILEELDIINGKRDLMDRIEAPNDKGRMPRELADLSAYKKLVERKEMTVMEACRKLKIGRTTYYRRCRQLEESVEEMEIEGEKNETV